MICFPLSDSIYFPTNTYYYYYHYVQSITILASKHHLICLFNSIKKENVKKEKNDDSLT
jgi:hypothetical protein